MLLLGAPCAQYNGGVGQAGDCCTTAQTRGWAIGLLHVPSTVTSCCRRWAAAMPSSNPALHGCRLRLNTKERPPAEAPGGHAGGRGLLGAAGESLSGRLCPTLGIAWRALRTPHPRATCEAHVVGLIGCERCHQVPGPLARTAPDAHAMCTHVNQKGAHAQQRPPSCRHSVIDPPGTWNLCLQLAAGSALHAPKPQSIHYC